MTQCWEEIRDSIGSGTVANPAYADLRFNADDNRWEQAKEIIGDRRVALGPQASQQWLDAPEHLAMVLARYRAAAALIGNAESVLEVGCGEGIGAGILARGRTYYRGLDTDSDAIAVAQAVLSSGGIDACEFVVQDVMTNARWHHHAVVALDVIEHLPVVYEDEFVQALALSVSREDFGVCVIGTPSATFDHLASPQSRAGHINSYTHDRLRDLMQRHFKAVQMFGMQDTALHFGHPDARHYHLAVGIGPR